MRRYKNLSGASGVAAYEIGGDFIKVRFVSGEIYLYDCNSTGHAKIEEMKKLAAAGRGLSAYIAQYVGDAYAAKLS